MTIAAQSSFVRLTEQVKLNSASNLTNLCNELTVNSQSLITQIKETPDMTRKQIKDVSVTVKKGEHDERVSHSRTLNGLLDSLAFYCVWFCPCIAILRRQS